MDEKVFDRTEKKYLITAAQKKKMLKSISKNMEKDGYFKSSISNIYFDTENDDLLIQSIDKPIFKEKLRARSYEGYDKVFLEIKTKIKDDSDEKHGYKRRVLITRDEYEKFITGEKKIATLAKREIEENTDIQIAKEIDYMVEFFKLVPKILIIYDRESYKGENSFRVTFDENLSYRIKNLNFNKSEKDKQYFSEKSNIIMEVKAHNAMPLWFVKEMSANKIYPQAFSKVGKVYEKIRKEKNV